MSQPLPSRLIFHFTKLLLGGFFRKKKTNFVPVVLENISSIFYTSGLVAM